MSRWVKQLASRSLSFPNLVRPFFSLPSTHSGLPSVVYVPLFVYHVLISLFLLRAPDHALAQLFDSADPVPFQTVRRVIHSELGEWPENLFIEFDEKPLGSAVRRPLLSVPPLIKILPRTHF